MQTGVGSLFWSGQAVSTKPAASAAKMSKTRPRFPAQIGCVSPALPRGGLDPLDNVFLSCFGGACGSILLPYVVL